MKWILFILQLLPTILQTVKSVQEALPAATGADRKALVMDIVTSVPAKDDEVKAVSNVVDKVVTHLNKAGELPSNTAPK